MTQTMEKVASMSGEQQFVTVRVGGSLFGLPIAAVHEVFVPEHVTRVPLAPPEVKGILNLRGRIVTTIDLRHLLGFEPVEAKDRTAVGIEYKNEFFGLVIDEVGEVLSLDTAARKPVPLNLEARWAEIVSGVHYVGGELLLVLDVEQALARVTAPLAA
jgi:purine-binding chemotaxis protein CheW